MLSKKVINAISNCSIWALCRVLMLVLFVGLTGGRAFSQNQKLIDSLETIVKTSQVDSIKMVAYGDLCWHYGRLDFDKALYYGREALKIAQKLNNQPAIALAYSDIGNTYTRVNKFEEALANHIKAYELREKLGLKARAAGSISNIAVIYKQQGNFKAAIEYMSRALKIYEDFKDEKNQALVHGNIGRLYLDNKNIEGARRSFELSLQLGMKQNSVQAMAGAYSGLVEYYFHVKNFKEAIRYSELSEKLLKQLGARSDLAIAYNTRGQINYETGKYMPAMEYFNKSLEIRLAMNDQLGIASCYKNMGACYSKMKNPEKAEEYLKKSIAIFRKIDAKDYLREATQILAGIYEDNQKLENSLSALKESVALQDSIHSRETTDRINELEIKYQSERKAKEIILLNKENKIQRLLVSRRNVTIGIIAGLLVVGVLGGLLFYNRYTLRQENKLQEAVIKQQDLATKAVLNAEENERSRISGELHDGLGQMFSAVKMNLSGISESLKFDDEHSRQMFEKTLDLVDESCREVRVISHQMAPNVLLKSGLATAVRDFIDKIDHRKLKVKLEATGLTERLEQNTEAVLYRVIQETVNNVIKHANANTLDIQLFKDSDGIDVMIEDNGKGFDARNAEKFEGIGLKNIRSRVAYLKGTVDFSSDVGKGTLVAIHIPL